MIPAKNIPFCLSRYPDMQHFQDMSLMEAGTLYLQVCESID